MQKPSWIAITTGLIALTLALPSSAALIIGGGVSADVHKVASNVFDTSLGSTRGWEVTGMKGGGDGGHAVASCQLDVPVDTIIINIVVGNTLDMAWPMPINGVSANGGGWEPKPYPRSPAGSSTCEQDVGTIIVSRAVAPGWGGIAAQPVGLTSAASQAWASAPADAKNGGGYGGGTHGGVAVVASNYADVYIGGGGAANAVSNCQILVAWNTIVLNVGLEVGGGIFGGVDSAKSLEAVKASPTNGNGVPSNGEKANGAVSSCKQKVTLIELVDGDAFIPPSS